MILFAYSVYDEKVSTFGTPFFAATNPAAIRMFTDLANDPNTTVGRHPEDFTLYHVGQFDDSSGELLKMDQPSNLGKADQYLQQQQTLREVS